MSDVNKDLNFIAYQSMLKSDEWYTQFKSQYVIFVDGKFVDHDTDRGTLLGRVRDMYKNQERFITEVDRNPKVIDIPTPLEIIRK